MRAERVLAHVRPQSVFIVCVRASVCLSGPGEVVPTGAEPLTPALSASIPDKL